MVTNPECTIPTSRTKSHAISAHAQAAHSVLVSSQHTHPLAFQRVPNVARPIIIAAKKDTTRN
jgi:hypothetical protein